MSRDTEDESRLALDETETSRMDDDDKWYKGNGVKGMGIDDKSVGIWDGRGGD